MSSTVEPSAREPLLEVCVEDLPGALAAEEGGAGRVELCADLSVGGVTPARAALRAVRARLALPLAVLVRPRAGPFLADAADLARMEEDVRAAREEGAQAVVVGVLAPDGRVDERALERLAAAARGLELVFHRAFDETPDADEALERLCAHGVTRLLAAGHAASALAGAAELARLVRRAAGRLSVMPGGGVRAEHARALLRRTGARELHSAVARPGPPTAAGVAALVEALRHA